MLVPTTSGSGDMVPISSMRGSKKIGHLPLSLVPLPVRSLAPKEKSEVAGGNCIPEWLEFMSADGRTVRQQAGVVAIGAILTRLSAGSPRE